MITFLRYIRFVFILDFELQYACAALNKTVFPDDESVCRFCPEKAMASAFVVLNELVEVSFMICFPF